jgi:DNA adenine methylase
LRQPVATITPFLKWAGGKRWLVEKFPDLLNTNFKRFVEPFVGSGAIFFALRPARAMLCDKNERLIETYNAVKSDWQRVHELLKRHQAKHSTEYYYAVRQKRLRSECARAAQFIYLNRTCWNGLYRVNLKGEFNVPIGTKQSVLLPSDDFERVAGSLKHAELAAGDFEVPLSKAHFGDLVFVDPPYTVKHNLNGFVKYNEHIFTWADQVRLREAVGEAVKRGAKVVVTNANHQSIHDLYDGLGEVIRVARASVIAGKASSRGVYEEVVIKCF